MTKNSHIDSLLATLSEADLPAVVLTFDYESFLSQLIAELSRRASRGGLFHAAPRRFRPDRSRVQDEYSHVAIIYDLAPCAASLSPGGGAALPPRDFLVADQVMPAYRSNSLAQTYLQGRHRVKIFVNRVWTAGEKNTLRAEIRRSLGDPLYLRLYDFPGVFIGQLFSILSRDPEWRRFNAPHLQYCSERVGEFLRRAPKGVPLNLAGKPMPRDVNLCLKSHADWRVHSLFDPFEAPTEPSNPKERINL